MNSNHGTPGFWPDYKTPLDNSSVGHHQAKPGRSAKGKRHSIRQAHSSDSSGLFGLLRKKPQRSSRQAATLGAVRVSRQQHGSNQTNRQKWRIGGIATCVLVGTVYASLHDNEPTRSSFKQAVLIQQKLLPTPTFRFDDDRPIKSDDMLALGEHMAPQPSGRAFTPVGLASLVPEGIDVESEARASLGRLADHEALSSVPDFGSLKQGTQQLPSSVTRTIVVESGDNISVLLNDNGVGKDKLNDVIADELVQRHLTRLDVGQELHFTYNHLDELEKMSVKIDRDTRLIMTHSAGGFKFQEVDLPTEYERVVTSGTISQSLYAAAERANLSQKTIMTLADIFQWELDFATDIRKGDEFSLVYDQLYRDGKYVGDGEILAAEFRRGDRVHRAIRFTDDNGSSAYYSPEGQAKRRSFMRHPVDVVRITSHFNPNRMHPVLNKRRAHKGVDYGSPYGSPIKAVANGTVTFSGDRGAYGRTVILRHDSKHTTLYAHMSKITKNLKVGKKVKRGDVIGYVGNSGRVTGTHLHYEFRINGEHVNPLKVKLPVAANLDKQYHGRLKQVSAELLEQIRSVNERARQDRVAANEQN